MRELPFWRSIPTTCQRAFKWDAWAGLLAGLFSGGLFPFLAVIARQELRASAYSIGLLGAAGSVGNLFSPLVAYRSRHRAKLPYAVWAFAAGRSFFLLMPLALIAPVYIAITFIAQAIASLGSPAYAAVIRDAYPVARRGYLMGLVRVLVVVGTMIGASVAGNVLGHVSYRWVFPAVTLLGLASVVAFSRIGVPAAPAAPAPPQMRFLDFFKVMRTDPAFRLYATCFYLYGFGNLIIGPIVPMVQVDELHISPQWVGYLATTSSAFGMIGYLYWGRFLDRHGPFRMMLFVYAVVSVYAVTYYFAHSLPVLLIASAATGLAWAGGDLGYINAAMRFGRREHAATYASMFAFLQALRGIPAPFIGAALSHVSFIGTRGVFLVSLCCWATAAVVMVTRGGLRMEAHEQE